MLDSERLIRLSIFQAKETSPRIQVVKVWEAEIDGQKKYEQDMLNGLI